MKSFNEMLNSRRMHRIQRDLNYTRFSIQVLYELVKKKVNSNPKITENEILDFFQRLFSEINLKVAQIPLIKDKAKAINVFKYISNNPEETQKRLKRIFGEFEEKDINKIKDEYNDGIDNDDIENKIFIENKEGYIEEYLKKAVMSFFIFQDIFPQEVFNNDKDFNRLFNTASKFNREVIQKAKNCYNGQTRLEQLENYIKYDLNKRIRDNSNSMYNEYIDSLMQIGDILKKLGLLEVFYENQNRVIKRIRENSENGKEIDEGLLYPLGKKEKDTISIDSFFSSEKDLRKLSREQLSVLNAYWLNRLTKELCNLNKSYFIADSLGMFSKMIYAAQNGEEFFKFSSNGEEIRGLYEKVAFLEIAQEEIVKSIDTSGIEKKNDQYYEIGINPYISEFSEQYGDEYNSYFSSINPNIEHCLCDDLTSYTELENAKTNCYKLKDWNIIAILCNLFEEGFSKNWGVILGINKDVRNVKNILIAADVEGINMPLRLHMPKSIVLDFLDEMNYDHKIQIYEGGGDFRTDNDQIPTQLLMPICKRQLNAIKRMNEGNNKDTNIGKFASHLAFLAGLIDYPEHLKGRIIEENGENVFIPYTERYIDLTSGEISEGKIRNTKDK